MVTSTSLTGTLAGHRAERRHGRPRHPKQRKTVADRILRLSEQLTYPNQTEDT